MPLFINEGHFLGQTDSLIQYYFWKVNIQSLPVNSLGLILLPCFIISIIVSLESFTLLFLITYLFRHWVWDYVRSIVCLVIFNNIITSFSAYSFFDILALLINFLIQLRLTGLGQLSSGTLSFYGTYVNHSQVLLNLT